jgi:hypothetical protein
MHIDPSEVVALSGSETASLVEKKATCPFIGSVVAQGKLAVRNAADDPLASIEDVRKLGNSAGGDLGDLLVVFASGNHALMKGESGKLDRKVPSGLFSLAFPGSQGSHPGHSGILQGDPAVPDSGRLSRPDFARLTARAQNGLIKRSEFGRFIAENLLRDSKSKVFGKNVVALFAGDLRAFVETTGPALMSRLFGSTEDASATHRDLEAKLTKLLGEDNLVGSAGEFGLLFALLANRPGASEVDGEPAIAVQDLEAMFIDKRLPEGWETWKKRRIDWVRNTTALLISAGKEYHSRRRAP